MSSLVRVSAHELLTDAIARAYAAHGGGKPCSLAVEDIGRFSSLSWSSIRWTLLNRRPELAADLLPLGLRLVAVYGDGCDVEPVAQLSLFGGGA
jgi:hypothetical protein